MTKENTNEQQKPLYVGMGIIIQRIERESFGNLFQDYQINNPLAIKK